MVRTWVSGGKTSEAIQKLEDDLASLEREREDLIDKNKQKIFEWASIALKSGNQDSKEIKELIAEYDAICLEIFEKQVRLSERLDEQAKIDSLG